MSHFYFVRHPDGRLLMLLEGLRWLETEERDPEAAASRYEFITRGAASRATWVCGEWEERDRQLRIVSYFELIPINVDLALFLRRRGEADA